MKIKRTEPQKRFIVVVLGLGVILGAIYLSPNFKNDILAGATVGFLLALGLCYLVLPKAAISLRVKRQMTAYWLGQRRYFTHPTMLPTTLGMLWFLLVAVVMVLFPGTSMPKDAENSSLLLLLFLDPPLFLIGLSGLLMLLRKEGINQLGRVYHGFPVYFNGVLALLTGWGAGIFLSLSTIFR